MARMRRLLLALAVVAGACGGEPVPSPSASPATTEPSSPSPDVSESPAASPVRPKGIPTTFEKGPPSGDLPLDQLVPPEALITGTWYVPAAGGIGEQVVIAYSSGEDPDPFATDDGLVVWQRFPERPAWRAVLGFFDAAPKGVLGIDVPAIGDVNGDGHDDLLTLESTGGSGACGVWRVLATDPATGAMSELFERSACDAGIALEGGRLTIEEAIYEPDDAHCCPSATRTTTMRWNGERWKVIGRETAPT